MATVNYIPEKTQTKAVMRRVIDYCSQEKKTLDEVSGIRYLSGINCSGEDAFEDFMATKEVYDKTRGTQFYHYDQSFDPKEDISPEVAHEIAMEFAEKAWPGHEVLVATHLDAEHIHSHFVINSVSFETGLKLRQSPNTLKALRSLSDEICRSRGLSVLPPYEKTKMKGQSTREYRASKRQRSWKDQLKYDIERSMQRSRSKEDFVSKMEALGYQIKWTPERKSITYTCPTGKKCRDNKLLDEKFLKSNMEMEFKIRNDNVSFPLPFTGWESQRKYQLEMKMDELRTLGMMSKLGQLVASLIPQGCGSDDPEEIEREIRARYAVGNLGAILGGTMGILLLISEVSKARSKQQERYDDQEEPDIVSEEDDDEDEDQGFGISMM